MRNNKHFAHKTMRNNSKQALVESIMAKIRPVVETALSGSKPSVDLEKEFVVDFKNANGRNFRISRADYEDMPIPLKASDFTDKQMRDLAKAIALELKQYNFDKSSVYIEDDIDDAFWAEMEKCAVGMGMVYYEDIENY